jgi:peptidoglycan hydrolase-like protein with peptidoglycan-binding domain
MRVHDLAKAAVISVLAIGPAAARLASADSAPSQPAMTRSEVKDVQQSLRGRGLYQGEIDGLYGPETAEAVRRFQSEHHLKPTGQVTAQTLAELGLIAGNQQLASHSVPGPALAKAGN